MGFLDVLKGIGKIGLNFVPGGGVAKDLIGAAGAGLGAISQGQAQNRGGEFAGQIDLERLLLDRDAQFQDQAIAREQEGRDGRMDAWRKLHSAQRTLSPGTRPSLSPYSVAPRQATNMERQGADALTQEVMARLQSGNPIAPVTPRDINVDRSLLKPGGMERAAGYLSPVFSVIGRDKSKPQAVR